MSNFYEQRRRAAFTLIELLAVIAVIALLVSILVPAMSNSRRLAARTQCLSNIRQLEIAQQTYASDRGDLLVCAGDGTVHGSWIGLLEPFGAVPQVRRCPSDESRHFAEPVPGVSPPRLRATSYGINNYVSPTHAPFGAEPIRKLTQVRAAARVIHLTELAESGDYAAGDHVHVQDFHLAAAPQITVQLIDKQMPLGRHGGRPKAWDAVLNYAFLDGHAESLAVERVYSDPTKNLFDPALGE